MPRIVLEDSDPLCLRSAGRRERPVRRSGARPRRIYANVGNGIWEGRRTGYCSPFAVHRLSVPYRRDLRQDGERDLGGITPPQIEPDGPVQPPDLGVAEARGAQPLPPMRLGLPRPDGADVARGRPEREVERGLVEFGVVGQEADAGGGVRPHELADGIHVNPIGRVVFDPLLAVGQFALLGDDQNLYAAPGITPRKWGADENATACINYTSGTTARPKGVQITHRNIWTNAVTGASSGVGA